MTKMMLALSRAKALKSIPAPAGYTLAECVELVRICMSLTFDEADWLAEQMQPEKREREIQNYMRAYGVSHEKAKADVCGELDIPTDLDAYYERIESNY